MADIDHSSSTGGNVHTTENHSSCSVTNRLSALTTLLDLHLSDQYHPEMDFIIPSASLAGLAEVTDNTSMFHLPHRRFQARHSVLLLGRQGDHTPSGLSIDSLLDLDFGAMLESFEQGLAVAAKSAHTWFSCVGPLTPFHSIFSRTFPITSIFLLRMAVPTRYMTCHNLLGIRPISGPHRQKGRIPSTDARGSVLELGTGKCRFRGTDSQLSSSSYVEHGALSNV